MTFKIVQTEENGRKLLVCVPFRWETNHKLYWPSKLNKHVSKLQKDENSKPDYDTWVTHDCTVKRLNISSYQAGLKEINLMMNRSETETDLDTENEEPAKTMQRSYNNLVEDILKPQQPIQPIPESEDVPAAVSPHDVVVGEYLVEEPIHEDNALESIKEDLKVLRETLSVVINNQVTMYDTQNQILSKMTEMQMQFEHFIKKTTLENKSRELGFQQMKSLKDVQEFEKRLNDENFKQDVQRQLKPMGIRGEGKGTSSAYAIVDVLFDRFFFTLCSWTGGSRSKTDDTTDKICFRSFDKIIKLFFDLIHQCDSTFTMIDCHRFFKTILRNATKRSEKSPKRASAMKTRPKTKITNITSFEVNNETETSETNANKNKTNETETGETNSN